MGSGRAGQGLSPLSLYNLILLSPLSLSHSLSLVWTGFQTVWVVSMGFGFLADMWVGGWVGTVSPPFPRLPFLSKIWELPPSPSSSLISPHCFVPCKRACHSLLSLSPLYSLCTSPLGVWVWILAFGRQAGLPLHL